MESLTPHLSRGSLPRGDGKLNPFTQFLLVFATTAMLFGVQTTAAIALTQNIVVPFALSAIVAALAIPTISKNILRGKRIPIISFLILVIFVNLFKFNLDYYSLYIFGPLQLIYSLFIAISFYFLLSRLSIRALQIWCLSISAVIAVLSILELNASVARLFESVTMLLSPNVGVGEAFDAAYIRDIGMHGSVRSKVFATEPSHTALTLMALGFGFFWTKPRLQLAIIWSVCIIICIWTIRSPILGALLILGPAFFAFGRMGAHRPIQLVAVMTAFAIFAFIVSDYILALFGSRLDAAAERGDGSFDMRFTVPYQFVMEFLPKNLFAGVGVVGNFDMLTYEILAAYRERGMQYIDYDNASISISNNLAQHFISFGFICGIASLLALSFCLKMKKKISWMIVIIQCATIWMFLGGYVAARVWVLCALVLAAARSSEENPRSNAVVKEATEALKAN